MKRLLSLVTAFLLAALTFGGCVSHKAADTSSGASKASSSGASSQTEIDKSPEAMAQALLNSMTLEQKVGQMFFLSFRQDENGANLLALNDAAIAQIKTVMPGGVILFGENIDTVDQIRQYIQSVQDNLAIPAFISTDQEGGQVQRITKTQKIPATVIPPMLSVGKTGDYDLARQIGGVIGSELTVFGFNMDFAPVCDVFSNPKNTVIGNRSFSSDPNIATGMATALGEGLNENDIIPVYKHFPGHGDTTEDTHYGTAIVNKTLDELNQTELVPFKQVIQNGANMIMVAHISLPKINGDDTPASLSGNIVTGLLRNQMGFDGVVITDDMQMGAIEQNYSSAQTALMAVKAGVDIILDPQSPLDAYQAVLSAVGSGDISEERINASVLRILTLKYKYNLFEKRELTDPGILGSAEHLAIVARVTN
jgi:beta-N-acetylhexosaminidase